MALRDQPYLPLYVQDFMTDEKLMRCSAAATGVYIRLMCYMHKSEKYGVFSIKEKDRVSDDISDDFARVFSLFSPYSQDVIHSAFQELLDEEVIYIYRNSICQKRMIKDAELSETRAHSGKKGAAKRYGNDDEFCHSKNVANGLANSLANTESEIEYENESESDSKSDKTTTRAKPNGQDQRFDEFWQAYPKKVGKTAARKCWHKIKPDSVLFAKILAVVETAKASDQWQRDNGRFIPNPTTWLNQGRWDDELPKNHGSPRTAMDDLRELHELYAREEDGYG